MKKLIFILQFALCGMFAFAGSFFANHLVLNCEKTVVENYIAKQNLSVIGVFDQKKPRQYLLCEARTDTQDVDYAIELGKKWSKDLSSPILYTLVHDSDVLYIYLIIGGEVVFSYDSWPGYFDGDEQKPSSTNCSAICNYFTVDLLTLTKILSLSVFEDDYIFAEDVLEELRVLFDLSESIYLGYTYARELKNEIVKYGFVYKEWN